MNVEEAVRGFLKNDLGRDVPAGADDSLLESGTIDSIGVMQLVTFLENTYGIKVADEELVPENFDTLRAISDFVARSRPHQHG